MKDNKMNKKYIFQGRFTEDENELIRKRIAKRGLKRSEYVREAVLAYGCEKKKGAQLAVRIQELLNHLEENGKLEGKTEERMADEIWDLLLSK